MMGKRTFATACAVLLGAISQAGPTALNVIPIADVMGHRELYVSYYASGTERKISKDIIDGGAVQLGFGDRMEFGVDSDFEGNEIYNIKVMFLEGEKWALSGGYQGIDNQRNSQSYLVGRYDLNDRARLHVGWLEDGKSRSMVGFDYALDDNWTFMADSISGKDSYTYLGLNSGFFGIPGFDITFSGGIPHDRDNGYVWVVTLGFGTRF